MILVEIGNNKVWFFFFFEVILVGRDKKNNKIVTKIPRNMFNRCQET